MTVSSQPSDNPVKRTPKVGKPRQNGRKSTTSNYTAMAGNRQKGGKCMTANFRKAHLANPGRPLDF